MRRRRRAHEILMSVVQVMRRGYLIMTRANNGSKKAQAGVEVPRA